MLWYGLYRWHPETADCRGRWSRKTRSQEKLEQREVFGLKFANLPHGIVCSSKDLSFHHLYSSWSDSYRNSLPEIITIISNLCCRTHVPFLLCQNKTSPQAFKTLQASCFSVPQSIIELHCSINTNEWVRANSAWHCSRHAAGISKHEQKEQNFLFHRAYSQVEFYIQFF